MSSAAPEATQTAPDADMMDFEALLAQIASADTTPPLPSTSTLPAAANDDPFAFLNGDPFTSALDLTGQSTLKATASSSAGKGRAKPPTSIFITSPAQRAMTQKREITKMPLDKLKEAIRGCEAILSESSRVANLSDGGAAVRARHALLLTRLQECEAAASSSSSSASSSQMDTDNTADTPLSTSPRSWSGGVRGFKQMLMDERMRSDHGISMRESIALQEHAFQERRETATREALERMFVGDPPRQADESDANEVVLDFDELTYSDGEDDDAPVDFGAPPDEDALWAMAEAAGFPRR